MFTVFSERLLTATDISAKDFHAYTVFLNDKEAMQLFTEDGFILSAENVTDIKTYNQNYISLIITLIVFLKMVVVLILQKILKEYRS